MFGVEARSSLPTINTMVAIFLAKVRRAISGSDARPIMLRKTLKRTGFVRGHDRRALNRSSDRDCGFGSVHDHNLFLRSLQLPVDTTVVGTALCFDTKSAVGP